MSTIGERLKELRGSTTLDGFAKNNGIHRVTLSRFEKGERIPDAEFLQSVLETTSACSEWLLMGTGPMYRTKPADETADMSAVLVEQNLQPVENINVEKKKTADMSAVLGVQRELTEALKQGMEFQKQVMTLTQENADLRVQAERHLSRIRELERENDELRAMRKQAPDFRSQSGRDVG